MSWKTYQRIWKEHNTFPAPCHFCDESVAQFGRLRRDGSIHHLDGDHSNDVPSNLAIAHRACHTSHHEKGKTRTEAERMVTSRALQGHVVAPETGAKISAALTGSKQPRATCEKCGRDIAAPHLRRHQEAGYCVTASCETDTVGT
jgi:hypothetical protein